MATVTLHLADGFVNETVEIQVNGKTVFSKENVSTSSLIGLAESIPAEIDTEAAEIDIFLPKNGLSKHFSVKTKDTQDIVISVVGDRIDWSAQSSPVGFA